MSDVQVTTNIQMGNVAIGGTITQSNDALTVDDGSPLPAGTAGTLTTRTTDTTGVVTLAAGHGLVSTDVVDVYFAAGVHFGSTVTMSGDLATLAGGSGVVLPAQDDAVVVTKRVELNLDFVGDDMTVIAASANKRCHLEFLTSGDANITDQELLANAAWMWMTGQGVANPFATVACDKIQASCGDPTNAATLKYGVLFDNTP